MVPASRSIASTAEAQVRRAMGESLSTFLDEFSDMLPLNTAREAARLATP
ncbi:MAG TPA: hypothetical protein VG168_06950 [Bryobacteraceae bacterium]|jgi:hypothetical protein|nr:hypothetical protein [Bryobacteraceae bacterium]